jgi:hypothetical protein
VSTLTLLLRDRAAAAERDFRRCMRAYFFRRTHGSPRGWGPGTRSWHRRSTRRSRRPSAPTDPGHQQPPPPPDPDNANSATRETRRDRRRRRKQREQTWDEWFYSVKWADGRKAKRNYDPHRWIDDATRLNVALFDKFMREKYDRHLWSLLTSAPTNTPDVRRPRHPGLPTDLFTVASQRLSLFDTTIYLRNKYGLPCLRSKYGDVAPTKPVDITPRYSQTDTSGLDDDVLSTLRFRANLANKAEVERRFSVCFDTGCTTSITNSLSDFEEPPV